MRALFWFMLALCGAWFIFGLWLGINLAVHHGITSF